MALGADGRPRATDFVSFWAAGKLVLTGHGADAYDWALHKAVATSNGIDIDGHFTFQYPPTFLLLTPLLALVPYPAAMLVWIAIGLPLYLAAVRLISGGWNATLAALAWPGVLWNTVVGQTGFLTAALLGAGIALIDRRPALAGICFGLLTCKPQFGLLIPVALIAGGRWRVIGWAALSTLALCAVSVAVLGISPWTAFFDSAARVNDAILTAGGTDFSKLQSLYGYVRALGGSAEAAWAAHGTLVLLLAIFVAWIWRSDATFDLKAAALSAATLLASPYAFIYDFVALAIPCSSSAAPASPTGSCPPSSRPRCSSGGVRRPSCHRTPRRTARARTGDRSRLFNILLLYFASLTKLAQGCVEIRVGPSENGGFREPGRSVLLGT